jgi:hypothetical protein
MAAFERKNLNMSVFSYYSHARRNSQYNIHKLIKKMVPHYVVRSLLTNNSNYGIRSAEENTCQFRKLYSVEGHVMLVSGESET